jgi:hypothetical protein
MPTSKLKHKIPKQIKLLSMGNRLAMRVQIVNFFSTKNLRSWLRYSSRSLSRRWLKEKVILTCWSINAINSERNLSRVRSTNETINLRN